MGQRVTPAVVEALAVAVAAAVCSPIFALVVPRTVRVAVLRVARQEDHPEAHLAEPSVATEAAEGPREDRQAVVSGP